MESVVRHRRTEAEARSTAASHEERHGGDDWQRRAQMTGGEHDAGIGGCRYGCTLAVVRSTAVIDDWVKSPSFVTTSSEFRQVFCPTVAYIWDNR